MKSLVIRSFRPSIEVAPDAVIDRHLGDGYRAADLRRLVAKIERRYQPAHHTRQSGFLEGFGIVALSASDGLAAQTRVELLRVPGAWRLIDVQLPEAILIQREQIRLIAARRFLSGTNLAPFFRRKGWLHPDEPVDLAPRTRARRDRAKEEREDDAAMQDLVL